ncbi:hypothetical protein [Paenibacillus swuensis]|nr:hypothetical protein [Paenibacillus swuensis]
MDDKRKEEPKQDPLSVSRGILIGMTLGAMLWIAIIAIVVKYVLK